MHNNKKKKQRWQQMLAGLGAHSSHCGYLWKNAFNTFLHNVIIIIHRNPLFQSELPRQSAAV